MARIVDIRCVVCDKESQEVVGAGMPQPTVCSNCQSTNNNDHRKFVLAGLKALPMEDRVERIEQWIYDYKPVHVPAPKF